MEPVARAITSTHPLEFTFESPVANAESLELRFATWARTNTADVICESWVDASDPPQRIAIPAETIADGEFVRVVELTNLPSSKATAVYVRLSSPSATETDSFAVWVRTTPLRLHQWRKQLIGFRSERFFVYNANATLSDQAVLVLPRNRSDAYKATEMIGIAFPESLVRLTDAAELGVLWEDLLSAKLAFVTADIPAFDDLCFALHRYGVCTIFVEHADLARHPAKALGVLRAELSARAALRRRCRFTLLADGCIVDNAPGPGGPVCEQTTAGAVGPQELVALAHRRRLPKVMVVTHAPRSVEDLWLLVSNCKSQTFPGPITLVLISGDAAEQRACPTFAADLRAAFNAHPVDVSEVANAEAACALLLDADVAKDDVVVLSGIGSWSQEFLAAHLLEHADGQDCVVIGDVIARTERGLAPTLDESPLRRDAVQDDSFLNCTSLNVSFLRQSTAGLCGLVEALALDDRAERERRELACAYDAYRAGKTFRISRCAVLARQTTAGRTTPAPPPRPADLAPESPDFSLIARRWLNGAPIGTLARPRPPELNILSYRWHGPHQYELHKLPHRFTLATGIGGNRFIDRWPYSERPLRPNVRQRAAARIDPGDYDLAILHFDENVLASHLSNGRLDSSWADPFAWLLSAIDLPKIAVCHGTPPFIGQFACNPDPILAFEEHAAEKRRLVEALAVAGAAVVCNSWQALQEWGFKQGRVIWHGFDPAQFPPSTYQGQVLTLPRDPHRPHYRGSFIGDEVAAYLAGRVNLDTLNFPTPALEPRRSNAYGNRSFKAYVDHVRRYSVYLNPTLRSPMPRSRGEAMLMGLIPVCMRNHDVELFVDNGENGFYADEPGELAAWIDYVFADPERPRRLGERARRRAADVFNHDRFLNAWTNLISEVV